MFCIRTLIGRSSGVLRTRSVDNDRSAREPVMDQDGDYCKSRDQRFDRARGTVEAVPPSDTRAFFHRVPPEGRPERQSNKPQPLMPALVMLARIGNGPVMEAGTRAEFPGGDPYGTGELQLGINDDNVADNSGAWSVRVTVAAAPCR